VINVLSVTSVVGLPAQYRISLPAQSVTSIRDRTGVSVEVADSLGVDARREADGVTTIHKVFVPGGVNVLVFQQPRRFGTSEVIAWLRAKRPDVAVVVDLDDTIPVGDYTKRCVALADVLTTSTQALADEYSFDTNRTFVIRSAVPASALELPSNPLSRRSSRSELSKDRMVGWTGNPITSAADLAVTKGALASVVGADRTDGRRVTFRSIGPIEGLCEALSLGKRDVEASGPLPTNLYRVALGEIDIAIAPSADPDSGFLRALEFAAAGVPVIGSRTFEHEELTYKGLPMWLVSNTKREWSRALQSVLAFDERELRDLAFAHRENVRRFHTVSHRAIDWAAAFRTAYRLTKET
jgi:glycosyltransferase involved in cell wall biosynthesis